MCKHASLKGPSRQPELVIDVMGYLATASGKSENIALRNGESGASYMWHVYPVSHDIVVAEVSLENVHDADVLPTLLNPLRCKLGRVYADGAYDSKASHQLVVCKGGYSQ